MSESSEHQDPPADPTPEHTPDPTPPRLLSGDPHEALRGIREQEVASMADAIQLHTDLLEELRAEREAQQGHTADLEAASSRVMEHADTLQQRIADLEERLRVQPSIPEPSEEGGDGRENHPRKRHRWL